MTANELITLLSQYPPHTEVYMEYWSPPDSTEEYGIGYDEQRLITHVRKSARKIKNKWVDTIAVESV